ncbi:hypothetical protein [Terrisporobacter sp.]|uniref:hypothetical protein n=1 Tax=Terrisporobacter sp. TaxID=1965305 RepID=UPI0028973644|nr:hypothetical protein [Terrisporobacter sp.]
MKNLMDFLVLKTVKEGIKTNLSEKAEIVEQLIHKTSTTQSNSININFTENNQELQIEATLHYGKNKDVYLVEIRLFNTINDSMINAYLGLFRTDLNELEECIDDVWSYDNFEKVKFS